MAVDPTTSQAYDQTHRVLPATTFPVSNADGSNTTLGATTDNAVVGDNPGTVSAKLRGFNKILNAVWDSVNGLLGVSLQRVGAAALALGQATMANSLPVTIASNQTNVPFNLVQVGGNAALTGGANGGQGIGGLVAAGAAVSGCNPVPIAWQDQSGNAVVPTVNQDLTILALAARTAQTNSADQTNQNCRGVWVFLNVTAASGTGGLTLRIQAKDPVSGNYVNINAAPTAVTATGTTYYGLYPGMSGAFGTQGTSSILPHTWRVLITVGDSSSYTYSVGASEMI